MDKHSSHRVEHAECVAYYRDALSARRSLQVRCWLDAHPQAAARARADATHEQAIASALQHVLHEPVPARLHVPSRVPDRHWFERVALASAIVLAATGGWWLGGTSVGEDATPDFTARVAHAARQSSTPATAVTDAAQQTVNDGSLNMAAAQGVAAPDLSQRGYQLIQRQQLAASEPPLVEFVYRNAGGERLRIYAETGSARQTDPSIVKRDGLAFAQWREGDTRYALVGDQPEQSLQTLAHTARTNNTQRQSQFASVEQWSTVSTDDTGSNGAGMQPAPRLDSGSPAAPPSPGYSVQPSSM